MERAIRFGVLLNERERQALAQLAENEGGLSRGAMVRNLIRQAARERGLWSAAQNDGTKQQREENER